MYASGASSFHLWLVEEFNNLKKAKDSQADYVVNTIPSDMQLRGNIIIKIVGTR